MKRLATLLLITIFLCGILFACAPANSGFEPENSGYSQPENRAEPSDLQKTAQPADSLDQVADGVPAASDQMFAEEEKPADEITEQGSYTSKEDVYAYLVAYGRLPENFITKNEADKLGWDARDGNLDEVAPGMSIGGDKFGNREGKLPKQKGRKYYECDINYVGGYRNGERLIFSNDGLYFYTDDHYETFSRLDD